MGCFEVVSRISRPKYLEVAKHSCVFLSVWSEPVLLPLSVLRGSYSSSPHYTFRFSADSLLCHVNGEMSKRM